MEASVHAQAHAGTWDVCLPHHDLLLLLLYHACMMRHPIIHRAQRARPLSLRSYPLELLTGASDTLELNAFALPKRHLLYMSDPSTPDLVSTILASQH